MGAPDNSSPPSPAQLGSEPRPPPHALTHSWDAPPSPGLHSPSPSAQIARVPEGSTQPSLVAGGAVGGWRGVARRA
eukprot:scaffold5727_cov79-Isochrysis_galbana.AAC.3